MAGQDTFSDLAKELGTDAVLHYEQTKAAPPPPSNLRLPGGIKNGIAQLKTMTLSRYKDGDKKGKLFFTASGIVFTPETFATDAGVITTKGMRTWIQEDLFNNPNSDSLATRKTVAAHLEWVMNQIKAFGVDLSKIPLNQLHAAMQALASTKPFFSFDTWTAPENPENIDPKTKKPYPARTMDMWRGKVAYAPTSTQSTTMQPTNRNGASSAPSSSSGTTTPAHSEENRESSVGTSRLSTNPDFDDMGDTATLCERAANNDVQAQMRVKELCLANGMNEVEFDGYTWDEIREALLSGSPSSSSSPSTIENEDGTSFIPGEGKEDTDKIEESEEVEESEEEEWEPQVGDVVLYRPKDVQEDIPCIVKEILPDGKLALKMVDGRKLYKGVGADKVTQST